MLIGLLRFCDINFAVCEVLCGLMWMWRLTDDRVDDLFTAAALPLRSLKHTSYERTWEDFSQG